MPCSFPAARSCYAGSLPSLRSAASIRISRRILAARQVRPGALSGRTTRRSRVPSATRSDGRRNDGAGEGSADARFQAASARSGLTHSIGASVSSGQSCRTLPPRCLPSGSPLRRRSSREPRPSLGSERGARRGQRASLARGSLRGDGWIPPKLYPTRRSRRSSPSTTSMTVAEVSLEIYLGRREFVRRALWA
jgi:hypothetical protein